MAKKEAPIIMGAPAWTATFGDLMNLLLCFFVLLFSMSSIDAAKFEAIAASFSSAFGIFTGGEPAIGQGALIGDGATQLNALASYVQTMGLNEEGDPVEEMEQAQSDAQKAALEEQMEASEQLYEQIRQMMNEEPALLDTVELNYTSQYVQLTVQGAILFDSAQVTVKEEAIPILNKVGQILEMYAGGTIEIEGHTDNMPMTGAKYSNNDELSSGRALSIFNYFMETTTLDPVQIKHAGRGEWVPIADNATPEGRARNRRVEIRIYNPMSPMYNPEG
ncbi:MAG: OmpA family protein [Lachnospiraceae bacterium]|nr:OmpA family protein [Lachnospiraceae bacterium]